MQVKLTLLYFALYLAASCERCTLELSKRLLEWKRGLLEELILTFFAAASSLSRLLIRVEAFPEGVAAADLTYSRSYSAQISAVKINNVRRVKLHYLAARFRVPSAVACALVSAF
jgi:hypothetical protein